MSIFKKVVIKTKSLINFFLSLFSLKIISLKLKGKYNEKDINLNIGSGFERYPHFINLDMESEWYSKVHKKNPIDMVYDFSKDKMNFNDNVVSNIYCSHVIEHATDEDVKNLFSESLRVLKKNGVFRITCPDAKFLYEIAKFENEYWNRYRSWRWMEKDPQEVDQYDYLTFHICPNKLRFNKPAFEDLHKKIKNLDYLECMKILVEGEKPNPKRLGDHINYFDFEKIKDFLDQASKNLNINKYKVIRSVPHGSASQLMSEKIFDKLYEQSLFIDYVKLS